MIPNERLRSMLLTDAIPHALLFTGEGINELAYQFAGAILGEQHKHKVEKRCHPDISLYSPEGKTGMHPLHALRKLSQDVALSPFEADKKIFIIFDAERMLPTSANALLKTLEEPASKTVILLTSKHPEKLLPTIFSRCQTIELPPPLSLSFSPLILDILGGETGSIEKIVSEMEKNEEAFAYNQAAFSLFDTVLFWYRDRLLLEIEGGESFLSFPDRLSQLKKTKPIPLEKVEGLISQIRLALERSVKLSTCLETLFLALSELK